MERLTKVALPTALALSCLASSVIAQETDSYRYIVHFEKGYKASIVSKVNALGGRVPLALDRLDAVAVEFPDNLVDTLKALPHIRLVEVDAKRYPLADTPYEQSELTPYGIDMVNASQLADLPELAATKVCIIDSGYDGTHVDLPHTGSITGSDDPTGAGDWDYDNNGHGTHVAGTIAAVGNNSQGVIGVLPAGGASSNLHIVKVFTADGWAYSSTLAAALGECQSAGAKVVNMSLGGPFPSRAEWRAFNAAYQDGILPIAAAGNNGSTSYSFPASYSSVVSVAALDETKKVADFSQKNPAVELSAPGVSVLSSVPSGSGLYAGLSVSLVDYKNAPVKGSEQGEVTGPLVDCGLGQSACGQAGDICLIQRGEISFADKALNCNGDGVVIYNNEPGMLYGTFGSTSTGKIAVGVSEADGALLKQQIGTDASIQIQPADYDSFSGTSMASPHVAGVAALVWSKVGEQCSSKEVRNALAKTALDLGQSGRDNASGYGLVQADAAVKYLQDNPCSGEQSHSLITRLIDRLFD